MVFNCRVVFMLSWPIIYNSGIFIKAMYTYINYLPALDLNSCLMKPVTKIYNTVPA